MISESRTDEVSAGVSDDGSVAPADCRVHQQNLRWNLVGNISRARRPSPTYRPVSTDVRATFQEKAEAFEKRRRCRVQVQPGTNRPEPARAKGSRGCCDSSKNVERMLNADACPLFATFRKVQTSLVTSARSPVPPVPRGGFSGGCNVQLFAFCRPPGCHAEPDAE